MIKDCSISVTEANVINVCDFLFTWILYSGFRHFYLKYKSTLLNFFDYNQYNVYYNNERGELFMKKLWYVGVPDHFK